LTKFSRILTNSWIFLSDFYQNFDQVYFPNFEYLFLISIRILTKFSFRFFEYLFLISKILTKFTYRILTNSWIFLSDFYQNFDQVYLPDFEYLFLISIRILTKFSFRFFEYFFLISIRILLTVFFPILEYFFLIFIRILTKFTDQFLNISFWFPSEFWPSLFTGFWIFVSDFYQNFE